VGKYKRDNSVFRASVAARVPARPQPMESLLTRMIYFIVANALKLCAIAGKIVGER
jgi:hypothetical protein